MALVLDRTVLNHVDLPGAKNEDWHRLLRSAGYLPTWILAGAVLVCIDWPEPCSKRINILRGLYVAGSAALAGVGAEILKLIIRRERPDIDVPGYTFRPFSDEPFSSAGLGMPSSHTMIAFAAAAALTRLFPRAAPVWIAFAAGCAWTRIADRAHFLSDAYLGALLGWVVAWWLFTLGPKPKQDEGGAAA